MVKTESEGKPSPSPHKVVHLGYARCDQLAKIAIGVSFATGTQYTPSKFMQILFDEYALKLASQLGVASLEDSTVKLSISDQS